MSVYAIYATGVVLGGTYYQNEQLVYEIPYTEPNENLLLEPKVKNEMGKTGSFEFSMNYGHPYYNALLQMTTMFRITYYGTTIFYGRVLTIDRDGLEGKKTVHCEGYMAFLIDTIVQGAPDEERPRTNCLTYIQGLINNHNAHIQASHPYKQFRIGQVPGNYQGIAAENQILTDDNHRYGSTGWQTTESAFSALTNEYGGYIRARYAGNTEVYLDWLDGCFNANIGDKVLEVNKNILSVNSTAEVEGIFTIILPIGKQRNDKTNSDELYLPEKWLYVRDIVNVYSDDELNTRYHTKWEYEHSTDQYGLIYKVVQFPNADTVEKLRAWAWDWIKVNYHGGPTQFNVTAIDMRIVGEATSSIECGDLVRLRVLDDNHSVTDIIRTVISVEYDIHNPENNQYTIGIPEGTRNHTYGESYTKQAANKQKKTGTPKGNGNGNDNETEAEKILKKIDKFWELHVLTAMNNNPEYAAYKAEYGDDAAASLISSTRVILEQGAVGEDPQKQSKLRTLMLDGKNGTMQGYKPIPANSLGVFRNMTEQQRSNYYATQASMTFDAANSIFTVKEQIDLLAPNAYTILENTRRPQEVLKLGLQQLQSGGTQYGTIATSFTERHGSDETADSTKKTSTAINGLLGKVVGGSFSLPSELGDKIDQAAQDVTGTIKGTVNASGSTAQIDMTNIPTDGSNPVTTMLFSGNGNSGKGDAQVGKKSNGNWSIKFNYPITYTDMDGNEQSSDTVSADDFNIPDLVVDGVRYDSLKMRLLVVDELIAGKATIGQLTAVEGNITTLFSDVADIKEITSNAITTDNLSAQFTNLGTANIATLVTNDLYIKPFDSMGAVNISGAITNLRLTNSNNTYTLQALKFNSTSWEDIGTFSRATTLTFDGWSGGGHDLTVLASPQGNRYKIAIDSNSTADIHLRTGIGTVTGGLNVYKRPIVNVPITLTEVTDSGEAIKYTKDAIAVTVDTLLHSLTINQNGAYDFTDLPSGKIGYGPITVDVQTQITSATWSWVNHHAHVVLQPQNQSYDSPVIDTITKSGDPSYDSSTGLVMQNILIADENDDSIATLPVYFDVKPRANALTGSGGNASRTVDALIGATAAKSITITDYGDGWNAVKLSKTITGSNIIISKATTGSTSITLAVDATPNIVYSTATHTYIAHAQAQIDGAAVGNDRTIAGGTEAFEAGRAAGSLIESASWSWSGGQPTVTLQPQGQSFTASTYPWIYQGGGDGSQGALWPNNTVNLRVGGSSGDIKGSWYIPSPWLFVKNGGIVPSGTLEYDTNYEIAASYGSNVWRASGTWTTKPDRYSEGYDDGYASGASSSHSVSVRGFGGPYRTVSALAADMWPSGVSYSSLGSGSGTGYYGLEAKCGSSGTKYYYIRIT